MNFNPTPVEKFGVGQPLRRREDRRLLKGAGRFVDDIVIDAMAHAAVVRSAHAHARITRVDVSEAAAMPGVLAVLTGEDWRAAGLGGVPTRTPVKNTDGSPPHKPQWPLLAVERVRFVGEAVAFVVAESRARAREAAEAVAVEYEPLPVVVEGRQALAPGAPRIWDHLADNVCVDFDSGDAQAVAQALSGAAHVVELELHNNRVTGVPIEPRGAIGQYDADDDRYTLTCATQNVHQNRNQIAEEILHVDAERLRVVAPDVGGGFGVKNPIYTEYALVLWAARHVGRPVKWINERTESFLSDSHGRDQSSRVRLGLDTEGRFLALDVESVGNLGPYLLSIGPFTSTGGSARTQGGAYRIPALHFHSRAAFTNAASTDPYRGAGRPEATFQIERIVDVAAAELGLDPLELRRRNALTREDLPYTTGMGAVIDSGDCLSVLERAVTAADWDGFAARERASRARGRHRGIGIGLYLECSGGSPKEHADIRFTADGRIRLAVGSQSLGTGHETVFPQILADRLQVSVDSIDYVQGDTDATPTGGGHGGSRSLEIGGSAVVAGAQLVIDKARRVAAQLLEAAVADVEWEEGRLRIAGTDRVLTLAQVIEASRDRARLPDPAESLDTAVDYERDGITYPYGCHVAEVEVDAETGSVHLQRYTVVDDFGNIVNPLTATGQVQGGTVQGIGQALLEQIVYEPEDGQLLSASLLDYALPRADDLPNIDVAFFEETPTAKNLLGVKGSGEAGCCGALPAVVNAVMHALRDFGVRHIEMPLTPEKVWRAVATAGSTRVQ